MDVNTLLSINQTIHNIGAVLFAAGPFYILLILYKRKMIKEDYIYPADKHIEDTFNTIFSLWPFLLILQGATGISFRLISLIFEGGFPRIAPIALAAFIIKLSGVTIAFLLSSYLRWFLMPELKDVIGKLNSEDKPPQDALATFLGLRKKRERLVWILLILAGIILIGAAFLRWNS